MAWTDPYDYTTGELVVASVLDTYVRDAMRWLGGADGRGTVLPTPPVDGQLFVYTADATNGVQWMFKYNSASASSYKWEFIGGPPLFGDNATSGTTTSTTYVTTPGSGVTVTVPLAGDYMVAVGGQIGSTNSPGAGVSGNVLLSYSIGATAAADADAASFQVGYSTGSVVSFGHAHISRTRRKTVASASTDLVTSYRSLNVNATASADEVWLSVTPVRVG